ncbi:MAG: hypothetical protein JRJ73_14615 [Deltaproteobacteria bacterium]|nr:hypothetical protein [Deltaproteobacteria bacterium]
MELYRIEGKGDGHIYGTWLAESEEEALRLMAEDAGLAPEIIDREAWIVEEVEELDPGLMEMI